MPVLVVVAIITGFFTLTAASIGAYAAIQSARITRHVNRKVETNHGGTIGEHVEDLIDWAVLHQEMDNDTREALGLARIEIPVRRTKL